MIARKNEVRMKMEERISKLPAWAQEHITTLQRQRDNAVKALEQFEDTQTLSQFFVVDHVCDKAGGPTRRTHYIQATRIGIEYQGQEYEVALADEGIQIRCQTGILQLRCESGNTINARGCKSRGRQSDSQ